MTRSYNTLRRIVLPDTVFKERIDSWDKKPWYTKYLRIYPGGYYSTSEHAIILMESRKHDETLEIHEFGHAIEYENHDHGYTVISCIKHAFAVQFDTRAFTSVLRLQDAPADLMSAYNKWKKLA